MSILNLEDLQICFVTIENFQGCGVTLAFFCRGCMSVQLTMEECLANMQAEAEKDLPTGKKALNAKTKELKTEGAMQLAGLISAPAEPDTETFVLCSKCKVSSPPVGTGHGTVQQGRKEAPIFVCGPCNRWASKKKQFAQGRPVAAH